jgi:ribonuclease R
MSNQLNKSQVELAWPSEFPYAVLAEAAALGSDPTSDQIEAEIAAGRHDFRNRRTITIDDEDAKDLDDAVDIQALPGGGLRLGVHIADVSHYVGDGGLLDQEARRRGTSVYPVGRVIPMLPPGLSNGICSLNPGCDRLTLSVILTFDANGVVEDGQIVESIIRSKARTTYTVVEQVLSQGDEQPAGPFPEFNSDLGLMQQLAIKLKARRRQRGAINFDFPETYIELSDDGKPIDIRPYPTGQANELIESFMIAANEYVARQFYFTGVPFIYRVHEQPDREKLARFLKMAAVFGVKARIRGTATPGQLAGVLEQVRHENYGPALAELLLRSLAKARYAPQNLGHFGLASEYYCHFTAPIRRYPDLFIHRVIKARLKTGQIKRSWREATPLIAQQSSEAERLAMQIERDSIAEKMAEYMLDKLGEIYDGVISGFGPAGIYVRLASTIEGLIPYRSLDDYYIYDEERLRAATRSGDRSFTIGDQVRVQVARANAEQRQIDFELLTHVDRPKEKIPKKKSVAGKAKTGRRKSGKTTGRRRRN